MLKKSLFLLLIPLVLISCKIPEAQQQVNNQINDEINGKINDDINGEINLDDYEIATFAGGCFWCMEAAFQEEDGVAEVISGYMGGDKANPTYGEVSSGTTGHLEVVQVYYDPKKISYEKLIEIFWRQIDPTDDQGQFADKGSQYKTAIFYRNQEEKILAEKSKTALEKSKKFSKPIVTKILKLTTFYPAEDYHQDYYKKRAAAYYSYEKGSGRADYKKQVWEKE